MPHRHLRASAIAIVLAASALPVGAEPPRAEDDRNEPGPGADTDPTKPIAFSLRDEHFDRESGGWQNAFILRVDAAILESTVRPRGLLLRADLPFVAVRAPGVSEGGLGDVYGQVFFVRPVTGPLVLALGSGLQAPSATDRVLGTGKWMLAPVVAPVVIFPGRGLAFVKIQDWIGVAGDADRADVHYLTVTPTFLWRVTRRGWALIDLESRSDWEDGGRTWAKAGFLLGTMLTPRHGISLKAELPFGEARPFDWILKAIFFATRF